MKKVLLVEDEIELARAIEGQLTAAGFRVWHAADGLRALELHAEIKPDLVVLDWMLPKLDGLAVLRQIRETAVTPVLMLTARDGEMDRVLGLEVGADDYLVKPFSMAELVARVKAQIRRQEMVRHTLAADSNRSGRKSIASGSLSLDPSAHRVTLAGEALDLSPTEFDLLHLLLRNPGRAFSRSYLLETIWATGYIGGDRSVDNSVLRLRKKLGPVADNLETVWGVGYRWSA